jgi:hypothetical protein
VCMHAGSCLAPAMQGPCSTSFWKLAAIDLQLGEQEASLSATPALVPLFLKAVKDDEAATVLCLEAYGASALQYLLLAHHAPHHKFNLGTCYCLETPASSEVAKVLPGMLRCVELPGSQQLCAESSQVDKLAAFTAGSSRHLCQTANSADIVIGVQPSTPVAPASVHADAVQ